MHDPVTALQLAFAHLLTAPVLLHGLTHIALAHRVVKACAMQHMCSADCARAVAATAQQRQGSLQSLRQQVCTAAGPVPGAAQ